ncbi:MAG: hypothetical protein JO036_20165 [Candidatus Eremiobacteraeota bacterium]|nr:hypothetical protein [Candidatus Eremiobacteraeota bacterium]
MDRSAHPVHGWLCADPTNGKFVNDSVALVARGRNYVDVSTRGLFRSRAEGGLSVNVAVEPASDER